MFKGMKKSLERFKKNLFLFEELVARDFKEKYKRTALGMVWSILSPLLTLIIMKIIFTDLFGRNTPHYMIYLFSGTLTMSYYKEATKGGMNSLMQNSRILSKINVPKYLFLFSKNISAFINFLLTIVVYFVFCIFDHIQFGPHMFLLLYGWLCLVLLNLGVGMILSALYVFFRDTKYLYDVFLTLLNYLSAVFYTVDRFSPKMQRMFLLNPVYVLIKYTRTIVINGTIPSLPYHLLMLFYPTVIWIIGSFMYRKYNHQFIYYF